MKLRYFLPPTYRELRHSRVAFVEAANLAVMWSNKAACTTVMKWVFLHNGLLDEALAYDEWVHNYRKSQYERSERYRSRLKGFVRGEFTVVKIVRNPLERAVSSYLHAHRTGYDDEAISGIIQRPLDRRHRFSFREFVAFLERTDLRTCNFHHRTQVTSVERRLLFRIRPSHIIRVEEGLAQALNTLERSLGLPPADLSAPLFASEHHTRRASEHGPAADLVRFSRDGLPPASMFYDDGLRERVVRLYGEDFDHYGYPTNIAQIAKAIEAQGIARSGFPQAQF